MAKRVFFNIAAHPNMNYDRSLKSVIWDKFPQIYRLYLDELLAHPEQKTHQQLPTQTLLSLKQCAPDVLDRMRELQDRGQMRFMGTFYSESIGQCQDGMTMLESAELGCRITREEMECDLEGFFLQEIAYTPQLPYVINKVDVQWFLFKDWDRVNDITAYWVEGLDGSRCVGAPVQDSLRLREIQDNPELIPDNGLILYHCDMEIPNALRHAREFAEKLQGMGCEVEWSFVSDYIAEVGLDLVKHPTPCTNKQEGKTESPSFSRWVSAPRDMEIHAATMAAAETRRAAAYTIAGLPPAARDGIAAQSAPNRPYTTWDVETPAHYPEIINDYMRGPDGVSSALLRMSHLLAFSTNSDGRGWYPLRERRFEREDGFHETSQVGEALIRQGLETRNNPTAGAGYYVVNPNPAISTWHTVTAPQPLELLTPDGENCVQHIRRNGMNWEHLCRLDLPAYSRESLKSVAAQPTAPPATVAGETITNGKLKLTASAEGVSLQIEGKRDMQLSLAPFEMAVKHLDDGLRAPQAEGPRRCQIIPGDCPRLIIEQQLDYHIHHRQEYVLDGDRVFTDWRFHFTAPTLVGSYDTDESKQRTDFAPGGLCAWLETGKPGDIYYDVPFGVSKHPNPAESYIPPLTYAFLAGSEDGVALVGQSGSQSYRVHAEAGALGMCMGRSTTGAGREKLSFQVGNSVSEIKHETDWYKEIFHGEYHHRFVIAPFAGDWRTQALPTTCRALAAGPSVVATVALQEGTESLGRLSPDNVRIAGVDPVGKRVILNEVCGLESQYELTLGNLTASGTITPFQILELDLE